MTPMSLPLLFSLKRANAERLQSDAMRGDAYESLACGWMAWTLLLGLAVRRLFNWWWPDPVTALVLVYFLVREGWQGISEWFERREVPGDGPTLGSED